MFHITQPTAHGLVSRSIGRVHGDGSIAEEPGLYPVHLFGFGKRFGVGEDHLHQTCLNLNLQP